ncbi:hypothetical protein FC19_GL001711 [Liquorilactobacillus aquaticus DSM 21051]|uniref:Uncharacterized protein n=1 Tax=Liquorilactobacillus aquaticus DSM 21051 TaxID=1423725 RepID=A0A0R2CV78_9LACO|nr:hypothetical protein FC19_GL001711 [Liquorilactobacillus aquaticus DSM 21051]
MIYIHLNQKSNSVFLLAFSKKTPIPFSDHNKKAETFLPSTFNVISIIQLVLNFDFDANSNETFNFFNGITNVTL